MQSSVHGPTDRLTFTRGRAVGNKTFYGNNSPLNPKLSKEIIFFRQNYPCSTIFCSWAILSLDVSQMYLVNSFLQPPKKPDHHFCS